jgi:hypothetical protein
VFRLVLPKIAQRTPQRPSTVKQNDRQPKKINYVRHRQMARNIRNYYQT